MTTAPNTPRWPTAAVVAWMAASAAIAGLFFVDSLNEVQPARTVALLLALGGALVAIAAAAWLAAGAHIAAWWQRVRTADRLQRMTPSSELIDRLEATLLQHNAVTDKPHPSTVLYPGTLSVALDRLPTRRRSTARDHVERLALFCESEVALLPCPPSRDLRLSLNHELVTTRELRRRTRYVVAYRTAPVSMFTDLLGISPDSFSPRRSTVWWQKSLTPHIGIDALELTQAPSNIQYLTLRQKRLLARVLLAQDLTKAAAR